MNNLLDNLKNGKIVIFPTDTAFGIGCRVDNSRAVEKLFSIRRRSEKKPVPILVSSIKMAKSFATISPKVEKKLLQKHWPGGLTVVLQTRKDKKIHTYITGGSDHIGIRMPDHKKLLSIIKKLNTPIIGTSANFPGKKTPYSSDEIDKELADLVDYIEPGVCLKHKESTVIDATASPWKTLRQGAVIL